MKYEGALTFFILHNSYFILHHSSFPIFPLLMIVDAHLDLAYNALRYGRDLHLALDEARRQERQRPTDNGLPTVTLPALRQGGIGLVFSTVFMLPVAHNDVENKQQVYRTAAQAHTLAHQQVDYYHKLADDHEDIQLVTDLASLQAVLASQTAAKPHLGLVVLMEGADPIREPAEVELWYERGVRLIGPAWADTAYAAGAWRGSRDGFTAKGLELMARMGDLGLILDVSHLSEKGVQEALERYDGRVVATHANCRALAPHVEQRNLSDDHIRLLGERGGVMGVVLYNRFLKKGHMKGERKALVTLDDVVAHVDHVCQLLGTAEQVAIGSDLDGGFGWADIPAEMDSIADLPLIGRKLAERGYGAADVANIMGGNWVRVLAETWG